MDKKKSMKEIFDEVSTVEKPAEILEKKKEDGEKMREIPEEEIKKLREKIEKTDLDDKLKIQVQSQANDLNALEEKNKLRKLLEIAKLKGVIFAVNVAKKMNDPYILDTLHDALVEKGYYKKFMK